MNILHMKYAVEVAKAGSINKAAEKLLIAQPNLSRSIKDLENELGITVFERQPSGMELTPEGDEFIGYARTILKQIEELDNHYKSGEKIKQKFSISVPRACYISEAFSQFSKTLTQDHAEIFYKETNSLRTINNIQNSNYNLGIIRYAENFESYFTSMLEEKGFEYELVTNFTYNLIMSENSPLAIKEKIMFSDLEPYIEIAHADPYVPSLPMAKVVKEELPDNIDRRIFIFERASQFELLCENTDTFMWVSPTPEKLLKRYGLIQKKCFENKKVYKDVLIYRKGYKLSSLDKSFISELTNSKHKFIK